MLPLLDPKTLAVYETLIMTGTTTIADIAIRTRIKRPSVYLYMDSLVAAGLAERININKKVLFTACNPTILERNLKSHQEKISVLSQMYHATQNRTHAGRPRVQVFEGKERLGELYTEIANAHSIRAWFSAASAHRIFADVFYRIADLVREKKINVKDIIADDAQSTAYAKRMQRLMGPTYSYKIAPFDEISNDTLVYGDCVAIFHITDSDLYAVRIEAPSIATTFRTIFDMSWRSIPDRNKLTRMKSALR